MSDLVAAVLLGLVEGATEFIPVSSTGHLIAVSEWLGRTDERWKTFAVFIQLGAILAVVWSYRGLFLDTARDLRAPASRRLVTNLAVGFLPAAVVGFLARDFIKEHLFTTRVVGISLVLGGIAILLIERWKPRTRTEDVADLAPATALGVGLAQLLALVPGVSRSGATIMGGYALGLSRRAAAEFSFFLAVPVMVAAAGYDLLKSLDVLSARDVPVFAVGFVVSFASALLVIRAFLGFVSRSSFASFAWYRIAFGALLLVLSAGGAG
ncbi:MAG TPA: undecaprenyl-diphosphate phosphatase [Gemmatimonadales bacterium]|nr:undecaprenyl-diphosphate phosphatase [Gemmatimonadales bacterium]